MLTVEEAHRIIEEAIGSYGFPEQPAGLYDPARYFMGLGGKRIRPVMSLLSANVFTQQPEQCTGPAVAIEVFHNFTLVHDDIMDDAPLRRGAATVHTKWDINTAILSGDVLLIEAYKLLMQAPPDRLHAVLELFTQTAGEVCEGQQMDMDFERLPTVSPDDYLEMIRLKTSVLLGCSMAIGALCGGADKEDAALLYTFGEQLGIAFQIMDDYLDAFPGEGGFGKKPGGDIERNKKTFLYIRALELCDTQAGHDLIALYASQSGDKVEKVLSVFNALNIQDAAIEKMEEHYRIATQALDKLSKKGYDVSVIRTMGEAILRRRH